ncbi:MAG TPA: hypothetical protein VIK74_10875 [Parasegetibacter sp.]
MTKINIVKACDSVIHPSFPPFSGLVTGPFGVHYRRIDRRHSANHQMWANARHPIIRLALLLVPPDSRD